MAIDPAMSAVVLDTIKPREAVRTVDWAREFVSTPRGSEIKGKFRPDLFPHMIEPLDCFDDPYYREITIQAASRLGKTVMAQVVLAKTAATNPHPMAIADADQKSTERVIDRTWLLFEGCAPLAGKLPPKRFQASDRMELADCLIHGCWSGSPATAADFAALVVVLNEIDKMSRARSGEADFAFLMEERAKGYQRSKIIRISTPALKGESRIEAARLAGDNRARYVPCPHCNHFQTLKTGNGKDPGGLRWKRGKDGAQSVQLARDTAWYECEKCRKKILDHHRLPMLNAGIWVPEGCSIKRGKLTGTPTRPGRHASFGPLGSHYSLLPTMNWGTIAAKFVDAITSKGTEKLRNYLNSWEGVTWDPDPVKIEPGELPGRLGVDEPPEVAPAWAVFLTLAADVGRVGEELIFYWGVCAWGQNQRGRLIDYGVITGREEFAKLIANASYRIDGTNETLRPVRFGVDSGDGSTRNAVVDLLKPIPHAWPIKGSSTSNFPEVYQLGFSTVDVPKRLLKIRKKTNQGDLLLVNTARSQAWIDDLCIGTTGREAPNFFDIPLAFFERDLDLSEQLLGDKAVEAVTSTGHETTRWEKRGENEMRDVLRYAWVLAWHYTKQGQQWPTIARVPAGVPTPRKQAEPRTAAGGGGGRRSLGRRSMSRR